MNSILSIDPALLRTGWSVLIDDASLVSYGVIETPANISDAHRLMYISKSIKSLIDIYNINKLVIEDVYYLKNIQTYCLLSQLSGVLRLIGYECLGNNVFVLPTTFIRSVLNLKNKEEVFDFITKKFNLDNFNFEDHNDICDSIAIGLCFLNDAVYKTKKMLEIEKTFNIDLRNYLMESYWTNECTLISISKKLRIGYSTLHSWFQNLKIPIRDTVFYDGMFPSVLTYEQEQVLLGTVLGDGGLYRSNSSYGNYCLQIGHEYKYKEYLIYKASFFDTFFSSLFDCFRVEEDRWVSLFRTVYCSIFTDYANLFYKDGIKMIDTTILNKLDALGIAIWFMDDGYYSKNGKHSVLGLCTHGFSYEENELIQLWFADRFDIDFKITKANGKYWHLKTGKKSNIDKFMGIVSEYVKNVDVMRYKLKENI